MPEVTQILRQIQQGNVAAASDLLPLVYAELRRLARYRMRKEQPGQTLNPTALVHEAYIRLVADEAINWDGRSHFFAAAAEAMRRILIENARRRKSLKRGGEMYRQELDEDEDAVIYFEEMDELLDLDAALTKLAEVEPNLARLVELRYFTGLSVEDTAQALGISGRTVKRNWAFARAWLGRELNHRHK
ncbi:MAG: sigma-70 family RNA polymerase sigma factor [Planctomycetes bacterium]|nr:sigma-70 family RNA polymerase sigma factor [Planctomycetota bacterium]